jgi:hypothetical protein
LVTVTESAVRRCRWCGRPIEWRPGPGRPPEYCRQSHRQRDYESRQRSAELGRSEAELVSARSGIDAVLDQIYLLECAVADVERDLADDGSPEQVLRALRSLLEAAGALAGARRGLD